MFGVELYKLSDLLFVFFFNDTATTEIYTLSLHDALPISLSPVFPAEATTSTPFDTAYATASPTVRSGAGPLSCTKPTLMIRAPRSTAQRMPAAMRVSSVSCDVPTRTGMSRHCQQ